jgi:hypothetical protein
MIVLLSGQSIEVQMVLHLNLSPQLNLSMNEWGWFRLSVEDDKGYR